jgi:hypothetical protein
MSKIGNIVKSPIRHVEAKIEATKENVKEDAAEILSKVIIFAALAFVAILFLLFISIMLANYLNVVLDSNYWGHGIVASIYLVMALVLFLMRGKNFIYKRSREYANYIVKGPGKGMDYHE